MSIADPLRTDGPYRAQYDATTTPERPECPCALNTILPTQKHETSELAKQVATGSPLLPHAFQTTVQKTIHFFRILRN